MLIQSHSDYLLVCFRVTPIGHHLLFGNEVPRRALPRCLVDAPGRPGCYYSIPCRTDPGPGSSSPVGRARCRGADARKARCEGVGHFTWTMGKRALFSGTEVRGGEIPPLRTGIAQPLYKITSAVPGGSDGLRWGGGNRPRQKGHTQMYEVGICAAGPRINEVCPCG